MGNFEDNYWQNQREKEPTCGKWIRDEQGWNKKQVIFAECPTVLFKFNSLQP